MTGQRRGVALIRVSKVGLRGEDLLSPDLQRRAITDYAQQAQITVTEWVEVLDQSASQTASRWWVTLDKIISRVEQGDFDSVLVWKFSRLARNRRRWAVAVDRVETAGGTIESATEGLDVSTSTGRLARGMLAELNAWESEVKGEQWREAQAYRLAQGLPGDGKPRLGYVRDGKGYAPDPVLGPLLAECYDLYLKGWSGERLADRLNAAGATTTYGNPWQGCVLLRTLDSGWAAGLIRWKGQFLPGQHPPLIDQRLFELYQERREARRSLNPRVQRRDPHEFTGLLKCACGANMHPRSAQGRKWMCARYRLGTCDIAVTAWIPAVIATVRAWVLAVAAGEDAAFVAAHRAAKQPISDERRWRKQQALAETRLLSLARRHLDGLYGDEQFVALRDEEQRRLDEALKMLHQPPAPPSQAIFQTLADGWDDLTAPERRENMMLLLSHVVVHKAAVQRGQQMSNAYEIIPLFPYGVHKR